MALSIPSILARIRDVQVPLKGSKTKVYLLGVLNMFAFGFGTIISGVVDDCMEDVIIGMLQLLPFVGWVWSIFWGILMVIRKHSYDKSNGKSLKHQAV